MNNGKRAKPSKKNDLTKPLPKNYDNYYIYLNDLDEYNDKCYALYLDFCIKEGKIPMEKHLVNFDLELKKINYNNLIK